MNLSRNSTTSECGFGGRSRRERMTSPLALTRIESGSVYPSLEWSSGGWSSRQLSGRLFSPSSCSPHCDHADAISARQRSSIAPDVWIALGLATPIEPLLSKSSQKTTHFSEPSPELEFACCARRWPHRRRQPQIAGRASVFTTDVGNAKLPVA